MKITIKDNHTEISVERDGVVTVTETFELIKGAFLALGFHPDSFDQGVLGLAEEIEIDNEVEEEKEQRGIL